MANANACTTEPPDFLIIEMNAMREPGPVLQPTTLLEIIYRAAGKLLDAIGVLVMGFAQMRMKATIAASCKISGFPHQFARYGKRRTRCQRNLRHSAIIRVMMARNHPLAIRQNGVAILHNTVRWKSAILFRQVHRSTVERHANAKRLCLFRLYVHRIVYARRVDIVMVGAGRATTHQQFCQRQAGCKPETVAVNRFCPYRIKRLEPVKQLLVDRGRMGTCQRLVEMVMGVDKPRNDDMPRTVRDMVDRGDRNLPGRDQFHDLFSPDDNPSSRITIRQNVQWVLEPER